MHSTPPSPQRWDGSRVHVRARRSLRVSNDSASRLLRCGQSDRCRDCGNRIEWYHRTNARPIRLHPHELPAERVPATCQWHVSCGVAHPSGDGSGWCRLPHARLCPARHDLPAVPELAGLRRALAVNTRRLIDSGAFVPPPTHPAEHCSPADGYLSADPPRRPTPCTSAISPTARWTRSSASPRPVAAAAAQVLCSQPRLRQASGPSCPSPQGTVSFLWLEQSWPSTRSLACLMPSSCVGGLNAAPNTPQFPQLQTWW
ncbi:DUF6083 domain-containing protein [Streptomyces caniscabiei]|uniref:DUF6083 domain-containing protein n=2 Tax=Streptomyces caniscabiei TaxID=2746961 RepID=A0ABU4MSZ6_9ACTN|nr:DUF6083 domain-containing protein [Streptomyces caniscabiei]MDX2947574.1 DUF6083 domain-containing protein [Streptomyces caniscabiei]MDX2955108.1 DUF6083 domain-containing protein [Streptomyces caniscabiei]MDX2989831.1 DUF6083 domain-containing protein [Streptomyces caniscabiei]MDX3014054.1 DUF6083 domain-containing protein [Streptomyces caniscabiei]MDX3040585.1 DUF6083 domain-containing protein [Streptomyces caniscabiei]